MADAKNMVKKPKPFGISGGLRLIGICLLFVFPLFFSFNYIQVTFFYFTSGYGYMAMNDKLDNFYQLYHFAISTGLPLSLLSGAALLGGVKFARKTCNIFLAITIVSHLLLTLSVPGNMAQVIANLPMRPSFIAFGAYAIVGIALMLYLNLSKRGEHTYDRFHNFPIRNKPPALPYIILAGVWSIFFMGIWLVTLIVYLDRYTNII